MEKMQSAAARTCTFSMIGGVGAGR
jgi:hypothetical protein